MVTQPCMWPASANTWPVPRCLLEGQPGRSRGTPHSLDPPSCKTGKGTGGRRSLWEEEGIGDRDPTQGREGHSLSIDASPVLNASCSENTFVE